MHNDVTILERLAEATHSSDLSHKTRCSDIDYIHALGFAGQRHRQGSALMDLDLTLSPAAMAEAAAAALQITRRVAEKRGWALHPRSARRIATEALRHYVNPACTCCKGRGMTGLDRDQPGKAERVRPCQACGGSGRQPLQRQHQREIREVLYVMEDRRRKVGAAVRRAMQVRGEIE